MANDRARAVTFEFSTPEIALDDEGFGLHVVDFDGLEVIQRPFRFELNLASRDPEIDFARVVNGPGKLEIVRRDIAGSVYHRSTVHGLVTDFQQGGKDGDQVMYRATLRPRLWALSLTRRSRVFSNRSVPEILRELMDEHEVPHEISLKATYPAHETVVQHHETDLAFFTRLATKDGIRFAFRHDDGHDTVVVSDAPGQDPWIEGDPEVLYKSHDGLVADKGTEETVLDAFLRERTVPGKVSLQDYNYRTPSAGMDAEDDESDGKDKRGHHQVFGQHYKDASDGKRLARVRREALHALAKSITARTVCTRFRAGHRFTLAGHYRKSLDGDYLIACVRHRGGQSQDVGTVGQGGTEGADYENRIGILPAAVPYRPPAPGDLEVVFPDVFIDVSASISLSASLNTTFNYDPTFETHEHHHHGSGGKMFGLMTATIAANGSYAAVDDQGRYGMEMHFPEGGGMSHSARQVQPYTGAGEAGFHFGTEAGNEVIYACLDGDPDRPVILGPVPNPEHPAPVAAANSSQHVIRTTHDNEFVIDDKDAAEYMQLWTPHANSLLSLGSDESRGLYSGIVASTAGKGLMHASAGVVVSAWPAVDGESDAKTVADLISVGVSGAKLYAKQKGIATFSWGGIWDTFKAVRFAGKTLGHDLLGSAGLMFTSPGSIKSLTRDSISLMALMGIKLHTADNVEMISGRSVRAVANGSIHLYGDEKVNVLSREKVILESQRDGIYFIAGRDEVTDKKAKTIWQSIKDDFKKKATTLKRIQGVEPEGKNEIVGTSEGSILWSAKKHHHVLAGKHAAIHADDGNLGISAGEGSDNQIKFPASIPAKGCVVIGGSNGVYIGSQKMSQLYSDKEVWVGTDKCHIIFEKDGTITVKAKGFNFDVETVKADIKRSVKTKAMSMKTDIKTGAELKALNIKNEAKVKNEDKGTMVDSKATGIASTKGALTKAG